VIKKIKKTKPMPFTTETIIQPPPITNDSDSATTYQSVDELLDEMGIERENVNDGKPVDIAEPPPDAPELIPDDTSPFETDTVNQILKEPSRLQDRKARFESDWIARNTNRVNKFICSLIADDDATDFGIDKEDLKEISDILYEWRRISQEPLPLWLELVVTFLLVFAPKWKLAFGVRKLKKQIQEQSAEIERLKKEQKELKEKTEPSRNSDTEQSRKEQTKPKKPFIEIIPAI